MMMLIADTFHGKPENGRDTVVLVGSSALERVIIIGHFFTDDKNSFSDDSSIDQVIPLICWFWVSVCWTQYAISGTIGWSGD